METLEQNIQPQVALPNSTGVLVLGILSIPACCFYRGILGIVLAVIALVLAGKAQNLDASNPGDYTDKSRSNLKAGKICAIIGFIINAILILILTWLVSKFGWEVLSDPTILEDWAKSLENR